MRPVRPPGGALAGCAMAAHLLLVVSVDVADDESVLAHDAVRRQYRRVDEQHERPDAGDREHHVAARPVANRRRRVDDGGVAQRGDQHQRVDRHVRRHVDQVVHQTTRHVAERPAGRRLRVRRERRDHDHETHVGDRQVQQQQIGDSAHARLGHDDVDDQSVSGQSDDGDEAEQQRHDDAVEYHDKHGVVGVASGRRRRVGVVARC